MKDSLFMPHSLKELWEVIEHVPDALIYAGGTDLLVKLRKGIIKVGPMVCLEKIEELKVIEDRGDKVFIGAGVSHSDILRSDIINTNFPVLIRAIEVLGSPQIRNMGTIGGNIVTASPAGDTLPPLYVLEAQLELHTSNSKRQLPIDQFIKGPGKTQLKNGEILTGILIPKAYGFNIHHFEKVGKRKALSISIVSFCALLRLSAEGVVEDARFSWGSVGPTVIRSHDVESLLIGNRLSIEMLNRASEQVKKVIRPIDDIRASAWYRKEVACNLLMRLINYKDE